jgi:hypothetical protein
MTSPATLAAGLRNHAEGSCCLTAAAELLITQPWLHRPDFTSRRDPQPGRLAATRPVHLIDRALDDPAGHLVDLHLMPQLQVQEERLDRPRPGQPGAPRALPQHRPEIGVKMTATGEPQVTVFAPGFTSPGRAAGLSRVGLPSSTGQTPQQRQPGMREVRASALTSAGAPGRACP